MAWNEEIKKGDIVVVTKAHGPTLSVFERAFVCDGKGFGANPKATGTAIYGEWLDGTGNDRIERFNISKLETLAFGAGIAYAILLEKEEEL